MMLSLSHKFAFLCVPKCSSTSIRKVLAKYSSVQLNGDPSLVHINARQYHRSIRPLLYRADPNKEIETFCIIRDPIDRLRSWYQYQARPELANPNHLRHERYTGNIDFKTFIEAYLADKQPEFARIGTQYDFVRLDNMEIGVDRIFRLDQMNKIIDFLEKKLGHPVTIPKSNRSIPKHGLTLDTPLTKRLETALQKDYELYRSI
jgi:Sulfotransferase family